MESSKKDLFDHYCIVAELSETEQDTYINTLRKSESELANQLNLLIKKQSNLTQNLTDSIASFTDGSHGVSVGDRLKNYQLTQLLGHGGMGQVFKAERSDGKIDQTVAIKFLHPLFEQYQSGKLLQQEAQALANLNHPHIASIFDICETENGSTFIVMEYVKGVTLDVYLQQTPLSVEQKLSLFNQIADAVLEAHNHQIIHADIKPENVLITDSGQAKLIDFGIMQLSEDLNQTAPKHITNYLGALTVNYASPEQLNGAKATISSDIYSLGSLLYFMLSGKSPFEGDDQTLINKIALINTQAPDDCRIPGRVIFKGDLMGILRKTLLKSPKDRYRTVTDLLIDINAFQHNKTVSVSISNRFYNGLKFFYRHRIIYTAITSIFVILIISLLQVNLKNELIIKEKKALEDVSQVLVNTFTQRDQSIADAAIEKDASYLPNPNQLAPKQYIEIMWLMFDDYYFQGNKTAYSQVIDTLMQWLSTQGDIEPLTMDLSKYRKVVSDNKDNDNYQIYADILMNIMARKEPLSPDVVDIFELKNSSAKLAKIHLLPLFVRLEKELITTKLSVNKLFLFHRAGGRVYVDNNLKLSVYHLTKAYELAKNNTDDIKLWLFVDTLYNLCSQLRNWKGPNQEHLVSLQKELHKLINQMGDKKTYRSKLSLLLAFEITKSMDAVAKILRENNITLASSLQETSVSDAVMIRTQSVYLQSLGQYDKAIKLSNKAAALQDRASGNNDSYYNYFIVQVVYNYLDSGDTTKAMNLIEEQLIPFITKYEGKSYLGYYQAVFCNRLALLEDSERLKKLCFYGFNNLKESAGVDAYWTKFTAGGLVSWYTLQPANAQEIYYVELFESDFEALSSQNKIIRGFILERYFIRRGNIEKAMYYQTVVAQSLDDYYGGVDAIYRYYHQMMKAEIALLKNDKIDAMTRLRKIAHKMCHLEDQNPQKIKYIKLQQSLKQTLCPASVSD